MIKELHLHNFKNFREANLNMGPFSVLVGTNASGKSNLRDAFRFVHGISRRYALSEIIGEKWVEGGVLQWRGIRGGTREAAFLGEVVFGLEVVLDVEIKGNTNEASYRIDVGLARDNSQPLVRREHLKVKGYSTDIFNSHPDGEAKGGDIRHLEVQVRQIKRGREQDALLEAWEKVKVFPPGDRPGH